MVLYKRKPIQLDDIKYEPTLFEVPNRPVWQISETKEVYLNYEDFLQRSAFYKLPSFTCEATGKTSLTFKEAWLSEVAEAKSIDETFPEPLKEPVLRKAHGAVVPRLDGLVDLVYDAFKLEYFPGEHIVLQMDGYEYDAVVKEKMKLEEMTFPDGFHRPASAKYGIELLDEYEDLEQHMTVDESALLRKRGAWTKVMLRAYLKNTVRKEPKPNAPWKVKNEIGKHYRIDPLDEGALLPPLTKKAIAGLRGTPQPNGTAGSVEDGPTSQKVLVDDLNLPISELKRPRLIHDLAVNARLVPQFLEVWAFFNVFLEVLTLDSFTLDDFGDALDAKERSELIDELFCSLLKTISASRSSWDPVKQSSDQIGSELSSARNSPVDDIDARGRAVAQLVPDWKSALNRLDFAHDNYINILIGLAYQLSRTAKRTRLHAFIDEYLASSQATTFYTTSADNKLEMMMALIDLSWQSDLVRKYIDECMENLTALRKERADATRNRKILTDTIYQLRLKMRAQFPKHPVPLTKEEQLKQSDVGDANSSRLDSSDVEMDDDVTVELMPARRTSGRRRISSRLAKHISVEPEIESNDESIPDEPTKTVFRSREDYEWEIQKIQKRVVKADHNVLRIDEEFRESDAQRLRKLGTDRFWNTYWWLESCGMPVYGMPNCSTSHANFATGRIFVQGPTEAALQELNERSTLHEYDYHKRRLVEEGEDVMAPDAWGFYEDETQLQALLDWLDPRGTRESKLKAAIEQRLKTITRTMENRHQYLTGEGVIERRSTRKTDLDIPRFQKWKNTMARHTLGAPHSGERQIKGVAISKKRKR